MQKTVKIYAVFTVIISSMVFLLISGFDNETMLYFTTVRELKAKGQDALTRGYRVGGVVVPGSVQKSADQLATEFDVEDEGEILHVVYRGVLPDTFKEGVEVLVEGRCRADRNLHATKIMTKCASKYDPAEMGKKENDESSRLQRRTEQ